MELKKLEQAAFRLMSEHLQNEPKMTMLTVSDQTKEALRDLYDEYLDGKRDHSQEEVVDIVNTLILCAAMLSVSNNHLLTDSVKDVIRELISRTKDQTSDRDGVEL